MNTPAPKTSPDAALGNLMAAALDVPAAPEQPAVPDDTLARTGNTADHQAGWFAGIDHERAEARESAGVGAQQLQERADKVVIANATSNPDLFRDAVTDLLAAVRMFRPAPAAGDAQDAVDVDWQLLRETAMLVRDRFSAALSIAYASSDATRSAIRRAHETHEALLAMLDAAIAAQRKGGA